MPVLAGFFVLARRSDPQGADKDVIRRYDLVFTNRFSQEIFCKYVSFFYATHPA